jgi:hypothetical protein
MRTSPFMVRRIAILLLALAPMTGLCGCFGAEWCPGRERLDDAANYRWLLNEQRYLEPLTAWVGNERLEAFLLESYREGGMEALKSRYGLECTPRVLTPPCDTCFTCRRTMPKTHAEQEPEYMHCQIGEMFVEADIGPGWTVTAMAFWKRPPAKARPRAVNR